MFWNGSDLSSILSSSYLRLQNINKQNLNNHSNRESTTFEEIDWRSLVNQEQQLFKIYIAEHELLDDPQTIITAEITNVITGFFLKFMIKSTEQMNFRDMTYIFIV